MDIFSESFQKIREVIDLKAVFRYNSISLGLFLSAYVFLTTGFTLTGSIFFVMALNYKQMELYHALPIFVFILSRSIKKASILESILNITKVGALVITTSVLIWLPFLLTGTAKDVLIRVFPFNRGLYEDKVASFWCAFSVVLKRLPIQNFQIQMRSVISFLSFYHIFFQCRPSPSVLCSVTSESLPPTN